LLPGYDEPDTEECMGHTRLILALVISPLFWQAPTDRRSFEVASVRQNKSGLQVPRFESSPGRFLARNATLKMLIQYAWDEAGFTIEGPEWISTDRYDIEARAADKASKEEVEGPMLQRLLEDRFGLVVRRAQRPSLVYELTVTRDGPKLREGPCAKRDSNAPPLSDPGAVRVCGSILHENNTLKATQIDSGRLAEELSNWIQTPVIDKTGITRTFDVELRWNAEELAAAPLVDEAPSIFTALRDQLGLKLEAARRPVDVLVVESAKRPAEN
jgi:uncharacterized protein (TIGR03435 family)